MSDVRLASARLNVRCSLAHNTLAVRRSAVVVKDAPKLPAGAEPIVIQADDNLFLDAVSSGRCRAELLPSWTVTLAAPEIVCEIDST